ncbi:uncharacterized protein PHALS_03043 [Plasmopara halstedii]|uniref:Uncharacterized protein n=1 Tax=Plasmopara halstedii TaxID=4781 RepID=A0A0P1A783_PLAHL|nr:uncharacterized protein PHALS_03043 [Plasmopara halstedii]CEG36495.1 hypothetical protein PHALS_03043 [Plasmopara halstedii]|eukprot:XP_024572864.1 hypothetical protein PHALS_03043 [Plasmopara halstedii]
MSNDDPFLIRSESLWDLEERPILENVPVYEGRDNGACDGLGLRKVAVAIHIKKTSFDQLAGCWSPDPRLFVARELVRESKLSVLLLKGMVCVGGLGASVNSLHNCPSVLK